MIKITIDSETWEFETTEEAEEAFPNILKGIDDSFNKADEAFSKMDDAFSAMDKVFEDIKKVPKKAKVKPPLTEGKMKGGNGSMKQEEPKNYVYEKVVGDKIVKRFDIKALLKNPIEKAKLIADAVRTARFFK